MEMFEKASKMKLRFSTVAGNISTEDLWDLPLTRNELSLDNIAKSLNKQVKENEEESFVIKSTSKNVIPSLKLDIVKRVIEVRLSEIEATEKRQENRDKKERIMEIIKGKQDESLMGKSEAELQELLESV